MTDQELLELAAKAIGLPECGWMGPAFMYVKDNTFTDWSPLTEDGDALRLAVKLGIQPAWFSKLGYASAACVPEAPMPVIAIQEYGTDPYAATRRAIVRAAAKIGKAMQ